MSLPRPSDFVSSFISGKQVGFSLVELVIFIVVMGVMATGLMAVFQSALSGSGVPGQMTTAMQLAQERMELVLATKRLQAVYDATAFDPCIPGPGPAICTPAVAGYTVNVTVNDPSPTFGAGYSEITVAVTGTSQASLTTLVANY